MAVVQFEVQDRRVEGFVLRAAHLAAGDTTGIITLNAGNADVSVHISGTVGGSTITVQGSLLGDVFNTLDDAYGVAMSYTAIGIVKPVGPAVLMLKGVSTGGSGVDVTIDVYVVSKVR